MKLCIGIFTVKVLNSKFCLQPHSYHPSLQLKLFSSSPILSFEIPVVELLTHDGQESYRFQPYLRFNQVIEADPISLP